MKPPLNNPIPEILRSEWTFASHIFAVTRLIIAKAWKTATICSKDIVINEKLTAILMKCIYKPKSGNLGSPILNHRPLTNCFYQSNDKKSVHPLGFLYPLPFFMVISFSLTSFLFLHLMLLHVSSFLATLLLFILSLFHIIVKSYLFCINASNRDDFFLYWFDKHLLCGFLLLDIQYSIAPNCP